MNTKEFLLEVVLTMDDKMNKVFNYSISQVFSPSYAAKINASFKLFIELRVNVFAPGSKSLVPFNRPVTYKLPAPSPHL